MPFTPFRQTLRWDFSGNLIGGDRERIITGISIGCVEDIYQKGYTHSWGYPIYNILIRSSHIFHEILMDGLDGFEDVGVN